MSAAGGMAPAAAILALLALALACWPPQSRTAHRLADLARLGRLRSAAPPGGSGSGGSWPGGSGPDGSGPGGSVVLGARLRVLGRLRTRRQGQMQQADVLRAVRLLAQELRGGADPAHAWAGAADAGGQASPWLRRIAQRAALGEPVGAALIRECESPERPEQDRVLLARLAAAWSCGEASGSSAADVLQHWADDAEARARAAADIDSQLAGPRASARLLAGLPLLGLALGAAMGADPIGTLLGGPAGLGLLAFGLALEAGGVLWTQRIVRSALRA